VKDPDLKGCYCRTVEMKILVIVNVAKSPLEIKTISVTAT